MADIRVVMGNGDRGVLTVADHEAIFEKDGQKVRMEYSIRQGPNFLAQTTVKDPNGDYVTEKWIGNPEQWVWDAFHQWFETKLPKTEPGERLFKKRRGTGDRYNPRDIAILGGDPSL